MQYCARSLATTDFPTPPFSPPLKRMELMWLGAGGYTKGDPSPYVHPAAAAPGQRRARGARPQGVSGGEQVPSDRAAGRRRRAEKTNRARTFGDATRSQTAQRPSPTSPAIPNGNANGSHGKRGPILRPHVREP